MSVKRIENNTDQLVFLPPLTGVETGQDAEGTPEYTDFPKGIRLQPGLNTVPNIYLEALHAERRQMCDKLGKPRVDKDGKPIYRYPGREAIAGLISPVTYTTANGRKFGPRITIYEPEQVADRADGPQAPATLPSNANAAMAIISVTEDRKALARWGKQARDANIKVAIQSRLAALQAAG